MYNRIYPGIDLAFRGEQRQIEFDFMVKPGSDSGRIALRFDGSKGTRTDASGDLVLSSAAGELRLHKPLAYQQENGHRTYVDVSFSQTADRIGFALGSYDHNRELVIDPTLSYSTYLGGSGEDKGEGIAVDSNSNVYVTGLTSSADFPGATGFGGGAHDAFVSKLDPSGVLVYSAYVGGSGDENGIGIAVDTTGEAYVIGNTQSADFPVTTGAFQAARNGAAQDAVVFKLNAAGSQLLYATYLGGTGTESGNAIAVDASGNAYLSGETISTDFPTEVRYRRRMPGATDGFIAKLNPQGNGASDLMYSTYLGGTGPETPTAIALDSSNNAYIAGTTLSTDLPVSTGVSAGNLRY